MEDATVATIQPDSMSKMSHDHPGHEARMKLYEQRFAARLDIFTGETPAQEIADDDKE